MNNPFQPRFQHDCKNCHFFGQYKDLDLYYCARSEADFGGTIVARYGNDAPEYHSSPVSVLLGSTLEHGVHDAHDAMVKLAKRLLGDGYVRLSTNYERLREKAADDASWAGVAKESVSGGTVEAGTDLCATCKYYDRCGENNRPCENGHDGAPAKEDE